MLPCKVAESPGPSGMAASVSSSVAWPARITRHSSPAWLIGSAAESWPGRTWTPPPELEAFLAAGPPPAFAGLGSMTPENAARLSGVIAEAARQAGTRVVIQAGRAGLTQHEDPPGQSILIGHVPHDWLFPRMAALVHHAGAGTTAAGLRAGVPAIGVPMIGDQPFWAARLAALGTGPRPIALRRLTASALAAALRDATGGSSYLDRARALATRIAGEDGARPVIEALSRLSGRPRPEPGTRLSRPDGNDGSARR